MYKYRVFLIERMPPNDSAGSRVSITDKNNNEKTAIAWDYSYDDEIAIAENFIREKGIFIEGCARFGNHAIIITQNFTVRIR